MGCTLANYRQTLPYAVEGKRCFYVAAEEESSNCKHCPDLHALFGAASLSNYLMTYGGHKYLL